MKFRWRWRIILLATLLILGVLYAARGTVLPNVAFWLDVGGPPRPADAVMLLNGGENSRPLTAAALVQGGWAHRVLATRVAPSPQVADGIVPPSDEINRRVLRRCGLGDDQIIMLDGQARSTYDEAAALAEFLASSPPMRLLIVTNGPHARRSRWIFSQVLGVRAADISLVSAPMDEFPLDQWWQSDKGFAAVVAEYLKLLFYAARYGYLVHGVLACALLLGLALVGRRYRGCHARKSGTAPSGECNQR